MGIVVTLAAPRAFLLTALLLAAIAASTQQRIDCRRFVFAPICRGVAAKRSEGGGGAAVRFLHSMHPQRTVADLAETPDMNDPYVTLSPEQADVESEMENEMGTDDRHRPHRERKVMPLGARPQALYRLYLPRLPHVAPLSEIEY